MSDAAAAPREPPPACDIAYLGAAASRLGAARHVERSTEAQGHRAIAQLGAVRVAIEKQRGPGAREGLLAPERSALVASLPACGGMLRGLLAAPACSVAVVALCVRRQLQCIYNATLQVDAAFLP